MTVSILVLAPLVEGHPDRIKSIKSVTELILIASYNSHTETKLKSLQVVLPGISSNIHHILPYRKSHTITKVLNNLSLLHYIGGIRAIVSGSNTVTEISEATHRNLIKDSYK